MKKTLEVWNAKPEVHGLKVVLMGSNTKQKFLAILLQNNEFVVLYKSGQGQTWKDITSERHDVNKLKFLGENDTEITSSDFEVDLVKLTYTYIFNTGVKCKKIKLGDDDVWKHTDDTNYADIKSFSLGLASNNFFVKNQSDDIKKIEKEPEEKTPEPTPVTPAPEEKTPEPESPEPTPVTPAPEEKTPEPETPEAEEPEEKTTVQQTGLAILAEPPPEKAAVTVIAPTGKPRPKKTPEVVTGPRTAITLNIADKASNSAVDFKEDYLKNVTVFSAKDKYVFNKIVKTSRSKCCGSNCCDSETVIWEAKNQNDHFHTVYVDGLGTFSKTKNMSLHLCNGTFKHLNGSDSGPWSESPAVVDLDVRISNSNIQIDYFKKDNYRIYVAKPGYTIRKVVKSKKCSSDCICSPMVIWEAHDEHALKVVLMGSKKEPKHLAVLMKSGGLTLLFKGGKGKPWEDITSSKNKITDLKMYTMVEGNTVELHRGHYSITLFNEFYGYLFYEGVGCVKVTHKDKTIWDMREEGDFGCLKGVFLDLKTNKFNVINDDDRCWVCEQVRKVNPVTLDVSSKASTDDFDFTVDHNRNIKIYTSKGNAMFNQVVKRSGSNCYGYNCCGSETVIWETNDPKGYASKVFADGVGACSGTKNVSIYLLNGRILHFGKSGKNEPWKKSGSKICLDLNKTSSTIGYDFVHEGEKRTFTAKPGYQFKTVKLSGSGDHTFWEAQTYAECSTKVTIYGVETTVENINIFLNNNEVKHFHKVGEEWVSKTSIVLNIETNTDDDLFEYRSTRNYGHFNPKPNLTIRKIVKISSKCNVKIWTAQPEDHGLKAVLMGSGKDEKFLSILLQSGNFVLLRKCGQGEPWENITKEKSDFSDIKMYSLDEGTSQYHELKPTHYDPIVFESRYGYEFKEGVKCVKITYNNETMWSHTDDPEFGYLKGLYLDLPKDQFSVTNLKDQTKHLTKAKVTKVTLDIEKTESTSEFEYTDQNDVVTFTPKSGYMFDKVSQGTKVVWESKTDVCGTLVRTKTSKNVKYLVVLLTNNMFTLFKLEEAGKWKDITSDRHDVTMLKFLDDNDAEITSSDYSVSIVDLSFTYIFKDGVNCKKVKLGEDEVWNHTDDSKFADIKSFSLGLASNSFFVKNQSDDIKKIEKEPEEKTPEPTPVTPAPEEKTPEPETPPVTTPDTTLVVTKSKFIALDIQKNETTSEFEYSKSSDFHKYTPKPDHVFSKVSQGTKDIWESKNNLNGKEVMFIEGVKYLAILLQNNNFVLFEHHNDKWHETTSKRHDVTKLKFFGDNDAELTKSDYNVSFVDFFYRLKFNTNVKCVRITYNDNELWSHTDDPKFKEITLFSLGLASNSFFVKSMSGHCKKLPEPAVPTQQPATPTKEAEHSAPTTACSSRI